MILEKKCVCGTINVFKYAEAIKKYECIGCKKELVNVLHTK